MSIRPNWRDISVADLTDEEVEQMTQREQRWCLDLLCERARLKAEPAVKLAPAPTVDEAPVKFSRAQIDAAEIAIVGNGRRIFVYPGEGANDDCFAGELLNPTEREMRGQGHISCLWDCSKVVALEGVKPLPNPRMREVRVPEAVGALRHANIIATFARRSNIRAIGEGL